MWQKQKLQHSPKAKTALEANLRGEQSPFNLSIKGLRIGVHNWTHGIETKSGHYLSPENANKAFIAKMTDYADPNRPKGELDVVCIMVTSTSIDDFIATLDKVMELLPDPTFKQAHSYAKSHRDLATTKMIKTPQISSPAFGQEADITPNSGRALQAVMRNVTVGNVLSGDPFSVIEQMQKRKAERQAENQQKVAKLLSASANVYAFMHRGLLDVVATTLQHNTPPANHIFTASVCFIGSDLSQLKEMLQNVN